MKTNKTTVKDYIYGYMDGRKVFDMTGEVKGREDKTEAQNAYYAMDRIPQKYGYRRAVIAPSGYCYAD